MEKNWRVQVLVGLTAALFCCSSAMAALGGGRGAGLGGHGAGLRAQGGAGRASAAINRSPSMSRSSGQYRASASRGSYIKPPAAKAQQAAQEMQRSTRETQFDRRGANERVRAFAEQQRSQGINRGPMGQRSTNLGARQGNLSVNQSAMRARMATAQHSNTVNANVAFNGSFYDRHHFRPNYYRPGYNWWGRASWNGVNAWLGRNWAVPYYYDTGGYYVAEPYSGSNGVEGGAPELYAPGAANVQDAPTQAAGLPATDVATSVAGSPSSSVDNGEWMPLGVYVLGESVERAGLSNRYIQLAMNRGGGIEGVSYNAAADKLQNITGVVDKETQQVSLLLAEDINSPMATTGLYNLTQEDSPLEVRFRDGSIQTWHLVRMQQ